MTKVQAKQAVAAVLSSARLSAKLEDLMVRAVSDGGSTAAEVGVELRNLIEHAKSGCDVCTLGDSFVSEKRSAS